MEYDASCRETLASFGDEPERFFVAHAGLLRRGDVALDVGASRAATPSSCPAEV